MIPLLFPANATTFTGSGICALIDAISCRVTEDNTGTFVLEMEYPTTGRFFSEIKINRIILAKPSMTQDAQPFDIKSVTIGENGIATFYANHVYYRLKNYICRANDLFLQRIGDVLRYSLMQNDNWHIRDHGCPSPFMCYASLNTPFINKHSIRLPISAYKVLNDYMNGSSTDMDSEYVLPVEVLFNAFTTHIYFKGYGDMRGQFRPLVLKVGKNIRSMTYEIDYSDCVEWIMPFWGKRGEDSDGLATYEIVYLTTQVEKDGTVYPAQSNASINRESTWQGSEILPDYFYEIPVDLTSEFSEKPTAVELFGTAKQWLISNAIDQPYANLQVEFTPDDPDMDKLYTQAIGANTIGLYDTCTVTFQEIGLTTVMKVVKTVYDVLLDRYERLEFGTLQRTIFTTGKVLNTEAVTAEYDVIIDEDPYTPEADPADDEEIYPDDE